MDTQAGTPNTNPKPGVMPRVKVKKEDDPYADLAARAEQILGAYQPVAKAHSKKLCASIDCSIEKTRLRVETSAHVEEGKRKLADIVLELEDLKGIELATAKLTLLEMLG